MKLNLSPLVQYFWFLTRVNLYRLFIQEKKRQGEKKILSVNILEVLVLLLCSSLKLIMMLLRHYMLLVCHFLNVMHYKC